MTTKIPTGKQKTVHSSRIWLQVLAWLVACWCIAPFVWQIITSLKTPSEIISIPATLVPKHPNLSYYSALFARKPFARYFLNSLFISTVSTLLCLLFSSMAAYSFARLRVRGARWMSLMLVLISLFPGIVFFFPLYEMVRVTGTANNPIALIIPYVTFNLPFAILILTSFFRTLSVEIEEAAKVDGFSRLQILFKIVMPLSAPALATTGILVFIGCWNEFLLSLTFMTRDSSKTITAGIASLSGANTLELPWGPIAAAVVISTLPLVVLVAVFQRRIIQGLSAGGVKG